MSAQFLTPRPACAHGVCSQSYIDTGDPRCVYTGPRDNATIVGDAIAIRCALPHLGLSDALTYADPSTVQGRAFRCGVYGLGSFYGLGYDRETLTRAYAWYWTLWADGSRNHVRGASELPGCNARLETEDPEVRACYGAIVRGRNALYTGFQRYERRAKRAGRACPAWPGTRYLPRYGSAENTIRVWLQSEGLAAACAALAPEDRGPAYVHMKASIAPEVSQ